MIKTPRQDEKLKIQIGQQIRFAGDPIVMNAAARRTIPRSTVCPELFH
jgi:hypothetical protein